MVETTQWEYRALSLSAGWKAPKAEDLELLLNELGQEGWEVVSVYTHPGSSKTNIVAKRPLSDRTRRYRSWPG